MVNFFNKYIEAINRLDPIKAIGTVTKIEGLLIYSIGPVAELGELCHVVCKSLERIIWAEVVGFDLGVIKLMTFTEMHGIEIGAKVVASGSALTVPLSDNIIGRIVDCMGRPIDFKGGIDAILRKSIFATPPDPLLRNPIKEQICTGVRSIDSLLSIGRGQRIGVFSGSGVGKSTLLGMIARNSTADINVIALVGERGREIRDFVENDLGKEGMKRSILIASASNEPPLARLRAAFVATTIAEYFRDCGKQVMLLFDSVTRVARAQREIGLAAGEPPAMRGFTPSVFSLLSKLLERSGSGDKGAITAFYTILVEGDDMDEPISDAVRGVLDGHIVLSRKLSEQAHFPAVDVLRSVSRLANKVTSKEIQLMANRLKKILAIYAQSEDLIDVGAYEAGSNPEIDEAIEKIPAINQFLIQNVDDASTLSETKEALEGILAFPGQLHSSVPKDTGSDLANSGVGIFPDENFEVNLPIDKELRS